MNILIMSLFQNCSKYMVMVGQFHGQFEHMGLSSRVIFFEGSIRAHRRVSKIFHKEQSKSQNGSTSTTLECMEIQLVQYQVLRNLRLLPPVSVAQTLLHLQELSIDKCSELRHIMIFHFIEKETLKEENKDKSRREWCWYGEEIFTFSENSILMFQQLKRLYIY